MLFSALVKLCHENITPIMLIRVEYQYQIRIIMFIQRSNIIDHFSSTICIEYFSEAGSFQHKCFSDELYLNLYPIFENSVIRHIYFFIIIYKGVSRFATDYYLPKFHRNFCKYVRLTVCLSVCLSVCLARDTGRNFLTIVTKLGPHMTSCTRKNPIVFLGQRSNN